MQNNLKAGVFCCSCEGEQDLAGVRSCLRKWEEVAVVSEHPRLCSTEGRARLRSLVSEHDLDRVLIATCAPHEQEQLFRTDLKESGLNPYLLNMTGLEACVTPERMHMALARLLKLEPVETADTEVVQRVLVVGSGIAALQSALSLARRGCEVVIADSQTPEEAFLPAGVEIEPDVVHEELLAAVASEERITVCTPVQIENISGQIGDFTVEFNSCTEEDDCCSAGRLRCGAVIIATGCAGELPADWDLDIGAEVNILAHLPETLRGLEENSPPENGFSLAFLVSDEGSKVPFVSALKGALEAKRRLKSEVYLLCPSAKVAAQGLEELYQQARNKGVVVIKYDTPPVVDLNEVPRTYRHSGERFYPLTVTLSGVTEIPPDLNCEAAASGEGSDELRINLDQLLLNEELVPGQEIERLAEVFNLSPGPRGFFQEDNVHLLPVATARRGIFVAGSCRTPMLADEELEEAAIAAQGAHKIVCAERMNVDWNAAVVDTEKCALCLTCLRSCPHGAIEIDAPNSATRVVRAACQGCGVCACECPAQAIQLEYYTDEQLLGELEALGGWQNV